MKIEISLPSMGIGAAIAAAVILAPFFVLYVGDAPAPARPTVEPGIPATGALEPPAPVPTPALLLENASPAWGDPDAPVTLVEFGDFQCHFCHRHFVQTEPSIVTEYIETGKAKMIFKDFVIIGPDSVTAAHAAHCAQDQGLYWEFHHAIYEGYDGERTGWASSDGMAEIAKVVGGLDQDEWAGCMESMAHTGKINASSQDARALGLRGTPAFYVISEDGEVVQLRGAKPIEEFRAVLDRAYAG